MNYANESCTTQTTSPIEESVKRSHKLSDEIHDRLDYLNSRLSPVLAPQPLANTSTGNDGSIAKPTAAASASPLQAELESHGDALGIALNRIDNLLNRLAV